MKKTFILFILLLSLIIVSCNTNSDLIECSKCGGKIERSARFCSHCGEAVDNKPNNTEDNNNNENQNNTEEKGTEGLSFYPLPDGTYAVSVGKAVFLEEIIIPSTYEGKSVSQILENGFSGCSNLKQINIPQSITFIGAYAFANCSKLEDIDLPQNIPSIEARTFSKCSSLKTVDIPNSITAIGDFAFYECSSLTDVVIPNGVVSIGKSAFDRCTELKNVSIPNSIEYIGETAFSACPKLKYEQYDNAYYLGNESNPYLVLRDCTMSTTITSCVVHSQTKIIYRNAFYMCWELQKVVIPESVTIIGCNAFFECKKLTSITFEGTVAEWNAIEFGEDWAFYVPATEVICSDGTVKW